MLESVLNFIKKRLKERCFPVKFTKFLRTPILKNICERLLLTMELFLNKDIRQLSWLSNILVLTKLKRKMHYPFKWIQLIE